MLLSRSEEVRIIISELENERAKCLNTLGKIRVWANMANVNFSDSELYLETRAKLEILENKIQAYKKI